MPGTEGKKAATSTAGVRAGREPEVSPLLPDLVLPIEARDHHRNAANARCSLVEYGDYESPGCRASLGVVRELLDDLGDELCYAYRHFPQLEVHPHAASAAEAAEAADLQAKFWLMHDRLFNHQDELAPALYRRLAAELPVDVAHFERDLASGAPARRVAGDLEEGRRLGVVETPTFFVNGRMHVGSYEFEALRAALVAVPGG